MCAALASGVILTVALPAARAQEAISRGWSVRNRYQPPPPAIVEAQSQGQSVRNRFQPPAPAIAESISQAMTGCNVGIFADADGDFVHDCNDICPGGNDLIDNDNNNIPDACEPGSCCFMTDSGFPGCFNSNKLECESPPFNGVYGGEGSVCDQNFVIIQEPSGEVFIHLVGPPATCNAGGAQAPYGSAGVSPTSSLASVAGLTPPPRFDAWKTAGTLAHSFNAANGGTPIPAGFFGSGSDVYAGSVALQGVLLNDPQYPGADTIIRRLGDPFDRCAAGSFPITAEPVAIEIIALSLASLSSAPLVVTYGGANPEQWDVTVGLGGTAPVGMLTATKDHCNGGTYTSMLNDLPQFTFRRRSDGALRGLIPPTHMTFNQTVPAPWVHDVSPVFDATIDAPSAFHAGFEMKESPTSCGVDTDGDTVRNECDNCVAVSNPLQADADIDGLGNVCDNCPLMSNPQQENCNADGVGDACEVFVDCQPNGVLDECDIAAGAADANSDGIPDACQCQVATAAVAPTILNAAGATVPSVKGRFLSFSGGDAGLSQAVRVRFVSLPGAFDIFNGTTAWVEMPFAVSELPGKGLTDPVGADPTFMAAQLTDAPVFADWSTLGVVHVFDERIIPSRKQPSQPLEPAIYEVQLVTSGCNAGAEGSFSSPLSITNARWGDVASLQAGEFRAPDGSIDVTADVLAVLAKFSNAAGAPIKVRAEMVGTGAGGPQAAITGKIDISDVLAVLGAFSGGSYPFAPPP